MVGVGFTLFCIGASYETQKIPVRRHPEGPKHDDVEGVPYQSSEIQTSAAKAAGTASLTFIPKPAQSTGDAAAPDEAEAKADQAADLSALSAGKSGHAEKVVEKVQTFAGVFGILAGFKLFIANVLATFFNGSSKYVIKTSDGATIPKYHNFRSSTSGKPVLNPVFPMWQLSLYAAGVLYSVGSFLVYCLKPGGFWDGWQVALGPALGGSFLGMSAYHTPAWLDGSAKDAEPEYHGHFLVVVQHHAALIGISLFMVGTFVSRFGIAVRPDVLAGAIPAPKITTIFLFLGAWMIGIGQIWAGKIGYGLDSKGAPKSIAGYCSIFGALFMTVAVAFPLLSASMKSAVFLAVAIAFPLVLVGIYVSSRWRQQA